jgi:hypothetical protein
MAGKQSIERTDSFGVVARTGFSLLLLGFGSALFGAMVIGPGLGRFLGDDDRTVRSARPAAVRVASAAPGGDEGLGIPGVADSTPDESSSTTDPDLAQYREGTGAESGLPPEVMSDAETQSLTGDEPTESEPQPATAPAEPDNPQPEATRDQDRSPTPVSRRTEPAAVRSPEPKPEREPRTEGEPKRNEREPRRVEAEPKRTERTTRHEPEPKRTEARRTEEEPRRSEREPRRAETETRRTDRDRSERDAARSETEPRRTEREPRRTERTDPRPASDSSRKPFEPRGASNVETEKPVVAAAPATDGKLFRVRVGRVTSREEAEKLRDEVRTTVGIDAFLVRSGSGYRVQAGVYRDKVNAEKIASDLRTGNVRPEVTQD